MTRINKNLVFKEPFNFSSPAISIQVSDVMNLYVSLLFIITGHYFSFLYSFHCPFSHLLTKHTNLNVVKPSWNQYFKVYYLSVQTKILTVQEKFYIISDNQKQKKDTIPQICKYGLFVSNAALFWPQRSLLMFVFNSSELVCKSRSEEKQNTTHHRYLFSSH